GAPGHQRSRRDLGPGGPQEGAARAADQDPGQKARQKGRKRTSQVDDLSASAVFVKAGARLFPELSLADELLDPAGGPVRRLPGIREERFADRIGDVEPDEVQ